MQSTDQEPSTLPLAGPDPDLEDDQGLEVDVRGPES